LRLNKALYGLKQAPRLWNKTLVNFLNNLKFQQLITDTCIFVYKDLIIAIYVDDIVIIGRKNHIIVDFKKEINNRFKTKDLGYLNFILGINVERLTDNTLVIHQKNYIDKLTKDFKSETFSFISETSKTDIPIQPGHKLTTELLHETESLRKLVDATKYRKVIGSLIYLMTCTRPELSYSVSILSRYMQERESYTGDS
jgi:hypothetical protein